MKMACVTGHRELPADKLDYVRRELRREIEQAISDGFTIFLSGFADGTDLIFADIVAGIKESNPSVFLEAAIPYRARLKSKNPEFQRLIKECDKVHIICEDYSPDCFKKRNVFLVGRALRVISVFNGQSKSGTAQTRRLAQRERRELRTIPV